MEGAAIISATISWAHCSKTLLCHSTRHTAILHSQSPLSRHSTLRQPYAGRRYRTCTRHLDVGFRDLPRSKKSVRQLFLEPLNNVLPQERFMLWTMLRALHGPCLGNHGFQPVQLINEASDRFRSHFNSVYVTSRHMLPACGSSLLYE